ncbi:hypothetical protein [Rhizohabitans arisaemae]|uniref:hypothetical protein n=1 Tax=Rhizohabitans arisaemae TaxID=2720610 RepID=UPI0024B24F90|nr:hypothetical protein [Rhizohabitans arisaemae]
MRIDRGKNLGGLGVGHVRRSGGFARPAWIGYGRRGLVRGSCGDGQHLGGVVVPWLVFRCRGVAGLVVSLESIPVLLRLTALVRDIVDVPRLA